MIASLFDEWNAALATKDPQQVANLYAHDAVLLPTVSNEVGAGVCASAECSLHSCMRPSGQLESPVFVHLELLQNYMGHYSGYCSKCERLPEQVVRSEGLYCCSL